MSVALMLISITLLWLSSLGSELAWRLKSTFYAIPDRLLDRAIRKEWLRLSPPYWNETCHTPRMNPWLNNNQVCELIEGVGTDAK